MTETKETHAYWEERSATILEDYKNGRISKENPVHEAQIEWAQLSNEEKAAGFKTTRI